MGFYIVADTDKIGTSDAIKEKDSEFVAPDGTVLVGRMHKGDENGDTTYQYAPLIADPNSGQSPLITLMHAFWTDAQKQSSLSFAAPSGWVIVGRKHDGDENGDTKFLIAQVVVNGSSIVASVDSVVSGNIKESAGTWWVAPALGSLMEVMTGSTHTGDENGQSTYTGSLLYCKG